MPQSDEKVNNPEKRLDVALAARALEIGLFWQRALFFWGFIAAALIAYVNASGKNQVLSLLIAGFGMVCSFSWTLANRGSKYWQEHWEHKVEAAAYAVIGPLFKEREEEPQNKGWWLSARRFSVSKLAIGVSDYVFLVWLALFAIQVVPVLNHTLGVPVLITHGTKDWFLLLLCALTLLYIVLLLAKTRSSKWSRLLSGDQ